MIMKSVLGQVDMKTELAVREGKEEYAMFRWKKSVLGQVDTKTELAVREEMEEYAMFRWKKAEFKGLWSRLRTAWYRPRTR